MPTPEEWDALMWEKAQGAKSARSLDKSVEEWSAEDLKAFRDAVSATPAANGHRGLRFTQLVSGPNTQ